MIIGSKLLFFKSLPSTNTRAGYLLKNEDIPQGSVIYTNYQSSGKGQMGNKWESEDGKNLLISIVLSPSAIKPSDQFIISMTISLGICDFIRRYIPECSIKWPNDIYIKNDKIAGILIKNTIMGESIESTIAGIGLNINQIKFSSDAPNPVSLSLLTGLNYELPVCMNQLLSDLDNRYKQLLDGDTKQIKYEYISHLYRFKHWSSFIDERGMFKGRIITVSDQGLLIIEKESGYQFSYSFKEVDFIL